MMSEGKMASSTRSEPWILRLPLMLSLFLSKRDDIFLATEQRPYSDGTTHVRNFISVPDLLQYCGSRGGYPERANYPLTEVYFARLRRAVTIIAEEKMLSKVLSHPPLVQRIMGRRHGRSVANRDVYAWPAIADVLAVARARAGVLLRASSGDGSQEAVEGGDLRDSIDIVSSLITYSGMLVLKDPQGDFFSQPGYRDEEDDFESANGLRAKVYKVEEKNRGITEVNLATLEGKGKSVEISYELKGDNKSEWISNLNDGREVMPFGHIYTYFDNVNLKLNKSMIARALAALNPEVIDELKRALSGIAFEIKTWRDLLPIVMFAGMLARTIMSGVSHPLVCAVLTRTERGPVRLMLRTGVALSVIEFPVFVLVKEQFVVTLERTKSLRLSSPVQLIDTPLRQFAEDPTGTTLDWGELREIGLLVPVKDLDFENVKERGDLCLQILESMKKLHFREGVALQSSKVIEVSMADRTTEKVIEVRLRGNYILVLQGYNVEDLVPLSL